MNGSFRSTASETLARRSSKCGSTRVCLSAITPILSRFPDHAAGSLRRRDHSRRSRNPRTDVSRRTERKILSPPVSQHRLHRRSQIRLRSLPQRPRLSRRAGHRGSFRLYVQRFPRRSAERKDKELGEKAKKEYLEYANAVFAYEEQESKNLFQREIPQVLLIHDSDLNAECLDALLTQLEKRGYKFISLDDALADPAYATPDLFVGGVGISWLTREN